MADNNERSGLDHMAQAVGAVRSAVKVGKALAGASKGAAFGPYGLAAGLAWEGRKVIAKVAIVLVAILLLPAVMLSAMFEYFTAPTDESMSAYDVVETVMNSAYQAVLAEIQADFTAYDETHTITIIPPQKHDTTRIICEYTALTDMNMNTAKLTEKLSAHSDSFFSFTSVVSSTDVIYTITYIGDDYITDQVFALTDEQKSLAADILETHELYATGGENDGSTD